MNSIKSLKITFYQVWNCKLETFIFRQEPSYFVHRLTTNKASKAAIKNFRWLICILLAESLRFVHETRNKSKIWTLNVSVDHWSMLKRTYVYLNSLFGEKWRKLRVVAIHSFKTLKTLNNINSVFERSKRFPIYNSLVHTDSQIESNKRR